MRSFAVKGRKFIFACAFAMAGLWALAPSATEAATGGDTGARLAHDSAVGPQGVRLAAPPAPSKPDKPAKATKEKPSRSKKSSSDNERVKEPTTFAKAFERGERSLDEAQAAIVGMDIAKNQQSTDPAMLAQLAEDKQQNERAAMADLRLALSLAGKGPVKDRPEAAQINTAHYHLCFLLYEAGQYYDAAVLGNFLARHTPPDSTDGRQGARIEWASYIKLYGESKQADKSFETKRIRQSAEYILERWPKEAEAEDAALSLLNFAINDRRLDDALGYLNRIPADSPRRGQSELHAGQALWAAYLKALQAPADERPPQEELDRFKSQTRQLLHDGIERIKEGAEPSATIATAMLSLAQVYLDMNEVQLAIATLEDPKFGPLTLVDAKSPLVSRAGFAIDTYKAAVRAYIAQQQAAKAKTVMDALDKAVVASGDPGAGEMLTLIYITLGRELQQQLERMRKDGSTKKDLDATADALETFLSRISSRQTAASYNSLSWVAETCYTLATGLDDPSLPVGDRAKAHYKHAADAYQQILTRASKDPKFVTDPEVLIAMQLRAAVSLRRIGDFDEAIKLIVEVLRQRPGMLTAQVAAAETLAAQGEVEREAYMRSILGSVPDKNRQNLIWGWAQLANKTQGKPKFDETFYHARLKIAEARLLYGLKTTDPTDRAKIFEAAKNDLWVTFRLYPSLGGPQSSAQFDLLLKRIQQQLKQPLDGLREFKEREATGGKDEKANSP